MRFSVARIAKTKRGFHTAINFFAQCPISELFFVIIEHIVLMLTVFYYKGMLKKVSMQRTLQTVQL